jgi:hypothetical protein
MFLPRKRNEAFAERMAAFGDDIGVFIRCLDGRGHCEAAERVTCCRVLNPTRSDEPGRADP